MYNRIHVDEKWFSITKVKDQSYLVPGEAEDNITQEPYPQGHVFVCCGKTSARSREEAMV